MVNFMVDSNCLAKETIRIHCRNNVEGVVEFERTLCDILYKHIEGKAKKVETNREQEKI